MSARRKKPKVTRAWCAVYEHADGPVLASLNIIEYPLTYIAFLTRKAARKVYPDHRIARVEIREVQRKKRRTAK